MTLGGTRRVGGGSGDRRSRSVLDVLFVVLADRRRRYVLEHLRAEGPTSLEALAERLTDRQFAGSGVSPTAADRDRTRAALEAVHVPRLVEASMVEFDADRGRVALTDAARQIVEAFAPTDRSDEDIP